MTIPSLDQTIARMKDEVLRLVLDNVIPAGVACFGDLHDYIDANELGGFCDEITCRDLWIYFGGLPDQSDDMPDAMAEFINAAQDAVNDWIANDGLLNEALMAEAIDNNAETASICVGSVQVDLPLHADLLSDLMALIEKHR